MKKLFALALLVTMTAQPFFSEMTKRDAVLGIAKTCFAVAALNQGYVLYNEYQGATVSSENITSYENRAKEYYGLWALLYIASLFMKKSENCLEEKEILQA